MNESPRNVTVGLALGGDAGPTPINADLANSGPEVSVKLRTEYAMLNPGQSFRSSSSDVEFPRRISSGATIKLPRCEASALVSAGMADYLKGAAP